MSLLGQKTLFGLLVDTESMHTLAMEDLDPLVIPNEELRSIYLWCMNYYHQGGRIAAPTVDVLKTTDTPGIPKVSMYDTLIEHEIPLDELPDETIEWAIDDLKATYLTRQTQEWMKKASEEITLAVPGERHAVLTQYATELVGLSTRLESRATRVELRETADDIMLEYDARKADNQTFRGMHMGLPLIDDHTNGIHPGELCIVGAGPKTGKSYFLDRVALKEMEVGRTVVLFTLENSIKMTRDRIACLAAEVNPIKFEQGKCTPEEEASVRELVAEWSEPGSSLHILKPEPHDCTAEQIVLKARLLGADSLLIDQLTFMEHPDHKLARHLQIRDIMHTVKTMISTGKDLIPCMIAHQINRSGMEKARRNGFHRMDDFAEGSEVERTADWACAMYQSDDARKVGRLLFQILAARRRPINQWDLQWQVELGLINVLNETALG